jgi:hypothetical protein
MACWRRFKRCFHRDVVASRLVRQAGEPELAQPRTLCSPRDTYATTELPVGADIHTLARQMGTSALVFEGRDRNPSAPWQRVGWLEGGRWTYTSNCVKASNQPYLANKG